MNLEGNQGLSQSGLSSQDIGTMASRNSKRGRDQSEEGSHLTALGVDAQCAKATDVNEAQCVKAMDLNLSSDTVSSDVGGDGREDQGSYLNNVTLFQSEKRMKCGPSNLENSSQTTIPSGLTANKDVVTLNDGNNVSSGMTSQNVPQECAAAVVKVSNKGAEVQRIEGGTQFRCDICSVKSTSAKDLETHLAGKRHARAKELALGMGTSSITKSAYGGSTSKISTPQNVQASTEPGSTHLNSTLLTTSTGQQLLADGSGEASIGYNPSGANVLEVNLLTSSPKCPELSDAKGVVIGQHASMDCSFKDFLKNVTPSQIGCDNGCDRYLCMYGTVHNPILADGFLEKICSSRVFSEGEPYKRLMASLSAKSNSDCVARALASALNTYGCPGVGDLQEGGSCEQAAGCSDSPIEDHNGMVTMHTRCFSNLLHDVRAIVMEDLFQHGALKTNTGLSSAAPISAFVPSNEDLNCSVCRVEYGSKADLDLHLAGRKHASLLQRVYSRCQLCNLNCNTERDFKTHLSGKKHASKLRLVQKRVTF